MYDLEYRTFVISTYYDSIEDCLYEMWHASDFIIKKCEDDDIYYVPWTSDDGLKSRVCTATGDNYKWEISKFSN